MDPKGTPGRQRMNAQERRGAIVEAALRLFSERGFRGTTTRELAAAVGVTEPVLYEHFKTKRDLYTAIIDDRSREGLPMIKELVERHLEAGDDPGFFLSLANLILRWHEEDRAFIRLLMFSSLEGHELKEIFYERQSQALEGEIVRYIALRAEQGALNAPDPALTARAFICMIAHHAMTSLLFCFATDRWDQKVVIPGMVEIFLKGVLPTRT